MKALDPREPKPDAAVVGAGDGVSVGGALGDGMPMPGTGC
jgi:hypothetical protein